MKYRKFLPAVALMLPLAAMTVSPALAQSGTPKIHKPTHHTVHKHAHKTRAHSSAAKPAG